MEFAASPQSGFRRPAQVAADAQPLTGLADLKGDITLHGHAAVTPQFADFGDDGLPLGVHGADPLLERDRRGGLVAVAAAPLQFDAQVLAQQGALVVELALLAA